MPLDSNSRNTRGRVRPLLVLLFLCAGALTAAVLRESGVLGSILGESAEGGGWFGWARRGSVAANQGAPLTSETVVGGPRFVADDDDLVEGDEILRREGGAGAGRGGASNPAPLIPAWSYTPPPFGSRDGPISAVIGDRFSNEGADQESSVSSDQGSAGDGADFASILSGLDEDDAILNTGQIFGVRVQTGGGAGGVADPEATPDPRETPDPNETPRPWVTGQSRGYTMLYAMHPRARAVVEAQVATLLRARIRETHIGVLVDGTFQKNYEYLRTLIDRLSQENRRLRLTLYLTNGPVMRRFETTAIPAPFAKLDPTFFRALIRSDAATRDEFSRIASEAARIVRYNLDVHPDNSNVTIVMLEDNLDRDSYLRMRTLAQRPFGRSTVFVRNPCVGCWDGNDDDSLGDSREEHAVNRYPTLRPGDAYSLDGVGFAYPGQAPRGPEVTSEQALALMRLSRERGLQYVGLWRSPWQGIFDGQEITVPDSRQYTPSTRSEQEFEIRLLREGLTPEAPVQNDTEVIIDDPELAN